MSAQLFLATEFIKLFVTSVEMEKENAFAFSFFVIYHVLGLVCVDPVDPKTDYGCQQNCQEEEESCPHSATLSC